MFFRSVTTNGKNLNTRSFYNSFFRFHHGRGSLIPLTPRAHLWRCAISKRRRLTVPFRRAFWTLLWSPAFGCWIVWPVRRWWLVRRYRTLSLRSWARPRPRWRRSRLPGGPWECTGGRVGNEKKKKRYNWRRRGEYRCDAYRYWRSRFISFSIENRRTKIRTSDRNRVSFSNRFGIL